MVAASLSLAWLILLLSLSHMFRCRRIHNCLLLSSHYSVAPKYYCDAPNLCIDFSILMWISKIDRDILYKWLSMLAHGYIFMHVYNLKFNLVMRKPLVFQTARGRKEQINSLDKDRARQLVLRYSKGNRNRTTNTRLWACVCVGRLGADADV